MFLIKVNVYNDNVNNVKKRLIKSFDDFILFKVFKMNKLCQNMK